MSTKTLTEWISRPQARSRYGISGPALDKAIAEQRVACRRLPGAHPRVSAADVEALMSEFTTGPADDGGHAA